MRIRDVTPHLKFSLRGFSPRQTGYMLNWIGLGFVPVHSQVNCEVSTTLGGLAYINLLAVLALCLLTPRIEQKRFKPLVFGFFVLVIHNLNVH